MLRTIAAVFGTIMLLIGILGFIPAFTTEIAGTDNVRLLGLFEVDAVHNVIHILTGLVALVAAGSATYARMYFQAFGLVYAVVFIIGLVQGNTVLGLFPVNGADHVLHAVIAATALYLGFGYRSHASAKTEAQT